MRASIRGIDLILEEGMNVKVCTFPKGEDPDSFAKKNSFEDVKNHLENSSMDFIQFKASLLMNEAKKAGIIKETQYPFGKDKYEIQTGEGNKKALTISQIGKIVNFQLRSFNEMLEKRNIILTATEDALKYLTNKGYDPVFGARPLKRVLQHEVLNKLSKEILAGNINDGDRVTLDYFEETGLVFRPTEN